MELGYDARRAEKAVNFFERVLVHTKGRYTRRPFILADWQRNEIIEPLFGTVRFDEQWEEWVRAYRTGWIEIGRGNGKSEMLAGIALYMLCADGEEGAEVYGAAKDRDQAQHVYRVAKRMVELSPILNRLVTVRDSVKRLIYPRTDSFYQVIAADASGNLGQNPHAIVFDEIISQPNGDLWAALKTGMGKRMQPMMVAATTAGNQPESFAAQEHKFSMRVGNDWHLDPTRLVYIKSVDKKDDVFEEANWIKANPALGDFLSIQTLRDEALEAQNDPPKENAFRQYRGNQWVQQVTRWMPLHIWDLCGGLVNRENLIGETAFGGLDLSATTDLAALALKFPYLEGRPPEVIWRYWMPEALVDKLDKGLGGQLRPWIADGFITVTEGDVIDYDRLHRDIAEDAEKYHVQEIAVDRWNSVATISWLEQNFIEAYAIGQTYAFLSPPMKEMMRIVKAKGINHGGNPVSRWNIDSLEVKTDPLENIRPVKPDRNKTSARIDGVVALIMAQAAQMRYESEEGEVTVTLDLV